MTNLYATLADVKDQLSIIATTYDVAIMRMLEAASRRIDGVAETHFYVDSAARYFDTNNNYSVALIDDCLSLSALAMDSEGDDTFDGETWMSTDYILAPDNRFPKWKLQLTKAGNYSFPKDARRYIKATGLWGYGDGESATPYTTASGASCTLADATTTTFDASDVTDIVIGNTIIVGSEQMYVAAIATTTLTVTRGVNGTAAASHSAAAISVYQYPAEVVQTCINVAVMDWKQRKSHGLDFEMIDTYQYRLSSQAGDDKKIAHSLGRVMWSRTGR